jgi:hypothetical protein
MCDSELTPPVNAACRNDETNNLDLKKTTATLL